VVLDVFEVEGVGACDLVQLSVLYECFVCGGVSGAAKARGGVEVGGEYVLYAFSFFSMSDMRRSCSPSLSSLLLDSHKKFVAYFDCRPTGDLLSRFSTSRSCFSSIARSACIYNSMRELRALNLRKIIVSVRTPMRSESRGCPIGWRVHASTNSLSSFCGFGFGGSSCFSSSGMFDRESGSMVSGDER
jgi:hypothetical protein